MTVTRRSGRERHASTCAQLLDYSDHERAQVARLGCRRPARLTLAVPAGRPLPDRRQRCSITCSWSSGATWRGSRAATPPEATGIPPGDWQALFEYADLVRADLRRYARRSRRRPQATRVLTFTPHRRRHLCTMTRRQAGRCTSCCTRSGTSRSSPTPRASPASSRPAIRRPVFLAECDRHGLGSPSSRTVGRDSGHCPARNDSRPHPPFEHSGLAVLPHRVPREVLAVHRDVDARRQHLRERQRAAEVEQPIRAAERVRNHRAGQDDRLAAHTAGNRRRRLDHRVGAVRDDDARLLALGAVADDQLAIGVGHVEAVDHHQRADRHLDARAAEPQHLAAGACRRTTARRGSRRRSCRRCRR